MDSTAGAKTNLKKYINLNGKWRFVPVVRHEGRPVLNTVLIHGTPAPSKSGTFYLEWRQDGKRIQKSVGSSPREALNAWRVQCGILAEPASWIDESENGAADGHIRIATALATFLQEVKATKSPATHRDYESALYWFKANINKDYVYQVTRNDVLRLFGLARGLELNQKTINKRLIVLLMALRNRGSTLKLKKGDWPKTIDASVEVYEKEEIETFFAVCKPIEKLIFQTFLCSGFRARELATLTWKFVNLTWKFVNFKNHSLSVRPNSEYKFSPKNYEERTVPVPRSLIRDSCSQTTPQRTSEQQSGVSYCSAPQAS
jgi:integrase/recombinase XerD